MRCAPPGPPTSKVWGPMPGAQRAKYIYRIARLIAERAREFAVLESLDNGKPIKESRDVDVPLASAHFFYHAGWADKLEYAGFGPARPLGVAGQVIPWNFPLLMAAWKLAPALAAGNTCVLKPAETTPLTALLLAEVCQQAELPAGRGQHHHRRRGNRRGAGRPPGGGQDRVHRLDRGGQADPALGRGNRQEAHDGTRRQGGQRRLRGRAAGGRGRGHRERHLLQPGTRLLRRLPAAGAGIGGGHPP